jgi:hypothetical protein
MLFKRPSSLRLIKPQSYFEVEDDHRFIIDPFAVPPIQLLGKRMLTENGYFPFLYLKSRCEAYNSLLLFVSRNNSHLVAWKVNHKIPIEYVGQFQFSVSGLMPLVTLAEAPLSDVMQSIQRSANDAPEWAISILHALVISLSEASGLEECLSAGGKYAQLSTAIFNPFICAVNISTSSLIDYVHHNISSPESGQIIHLFNTFSTRVGSDFETPFSNIARYCILREIICVVTGKHVVLDPLTWEHVLSDCTALCSATYYDEYPHVKSRLIRYKSALGHYFVERRGPGWLDVTSSIILPNGFFVEVQTGQQWGQSITSDEIPWVLKLFSNDPLPIVKGDQQLLISEVAGDNLGHTLWNEVSGYVEFILTCQAAGWKPNKISPVLPSSFPSRFSKLGVRSSFYPYIHKSLLSQSSTPKEDGIIINYLAAMNQQELSSQIFVRNQIVSFRYPRVSKTVVSTILHDFPPTDQCKIRLFKNLRFHNKAQTNTAECLQELFGQLAVHSNPQIHPSNIELDLEYSEHHEDTINDITRVCEMHGVGLNLCESYEIPELLQLIASSCIAIVPIGSGAVLPTWVFHKHTILHAEKAHRGQIDWWHLAGNSESSRQYLIPGDAIQDDPNSTGNAYSNYQIEPTAYASTVISALEDYLQAQLQAFTLTS